MSVTRVLGGVALQAAGRRPHNVLAVCPGAARARTTVAAIPRKPIDGEEYLSNLPEEDELLWQDSNPMPEPALDQLSMFGDSVEKGYALKMLLGGFAFFLTLGTAASIWDPASKKPVTERDLPFDNLKVELGGKPE